MKKAYKLLILLLILAASIGLGITYTEARVCFVVGGCDKDDAAKPKAKVQDCPALGFKYVADGRKMDKNEGGIAKYVGKEGPCTKNGKAYFKQKVCKNKYAYVAPTTINRIDSETGEIEKIEGLEALDLIKKALSTNYHRADVSVCGENATPGENFCDDSYGLKSAEVTSVRKYTQCTCDAKYKYLAEDIRTGFKIPYDQGAKSCTTSGVDGNDGKLRYDLVKCSGDYEAGGYWKETCGTKEYAFRSDTWGDLTCNLCMEGQVPPDPCADGSCDPCADGSCDSPCTGANLYDTSTACFEGNGAGDTRSYTCREIMVGDAVCYERSYVSCAELSKVEYYGADDGYYGYYGSGVRGAFIQYFDTVDECMNGIASNEVCSSRTLWSDTYYGAFDGKLCYFRETRDVTRRCVDYGKFDNINDCMGRKGTAEEDYSCRVVMTDGLTCYERMEVDCRTFSIVVPVPYYGPSYYYYQGYMQDGTVLYYNTYDECMKYSDGAGCTSKVISGKTCYYKNKTAGKAGLRNILSGVVDKFKNIFERPTHVEKRGIDQRPTRFGKDNQGLPSEVLDSFKPSESGSYETNVNQFRDQINKLMNDSASQSATNTSPKYSGNGINQRVGNYVQREVGSLAKERAVTQRKDNEAAVNRAMFK